MQILHVAKGNISQLLQCADSLHEADVALDEIQESDAGAMPGEKYAVAAQAAADIQKFFAAENVLIMLLVPAAHRECLTCGGAQVSGVPDFENFRIGRVQQIRAFDPVALPVGNLAPLGALQVERFPERGIL